MATFDVDVIVFDLDGTLIDSKADIANALNWTLEKLGHDPLPLEIIEGFVGNGVFPLIRRTVEAAGNPEREDEMYAIFKQRYWDHLLDDTRLFDTVPETIDELKGRYRMGVVSNKPERYTRRIIHELGLGEAMGGAVYGGDSLPVKKPDPTALLKIAEKYGVAPSRMLMVGDSAVDMATGKNAGAAIVGVTYGFRDKQELIEAGAEVLIDRFDRLLDLLG